jgi:hypothetical protein
VSEPRDSLGRVDTAIATLARGLAAGAYAALAPAELGLVLEAAAGVASKALDLERKLRIAHEVAQRRAPEDAPGPGGTDQEGATA